jgi:hypothetical protein
MSKSLLGKLKYKIVIREPSWSNSVTLWEEFETLSSAEVFLRDVADTYPEKTLFFIISVFNKDRMPTTRKSFYLDEYGRLISRKRKWVPDKYRPTEQVESLPEIVEAIEASEAIEDYNILPYAEQSSFDYVVNQLVSDRDRKLWSSKERGYFKPGDLKDE